MRPLLAALADPAAREAFARVTLGMASATPARREERALTQLKSAGLIWRTKDGWSVDEARLRDLLARGARPRPTEEPDRFLTTDGRIDRYPSNPEEREGLLQVIAARVIDETETLGESELGARLTKLTDDTALLRRMLVDHGIVRRERSGTAYRRVSGEDAKG